MSGPSVATTLYVYTYTDGTDTYALTGGPTVLPG